jgi:hypothetical protein
MKSEKAPGPKKNPPEAMKALAEVTADIMPDLIQHIWDTEEVPAEWQTCVYIVKQGFFFQDFGNMTHMHEIGTFSDVLLKIGKNCIT